jgi:predicted alpha/beta superfamily hydrolase
MAAENASDRAKAAIREYSKPLLLRERAVSEHLFGAESEPQHRIMISAPQGPPPNPGFPVIYVLDGDAWFGTAVEIAKMREYEKLDPAIIVGIGYPSHSFFDALGRSYDFSPPGASDPDMQEIPLGGADAFLSFLNETLKPWMRAHYRLDPARHILFGHSMGGLFALYALFKAPESFSAYIAASPDLPFSKHIISNGEVAFETSPARRNARVLVTAGELESRPSSALMDDYRRYYMAHPEAHPGETAEQAVKELFSGGEKNYDKIADTRALVDRLARAGVHASFIEFAGEEHMSAAVSALNRGIPYALRPGQ